VRGVRVPRPARARATEPRAAAALSHT
jgi:hypothetical protein